MLQDRYLNPFTDFGFKTLFGNEVNKELLVDFLNQLLPEKHHIQDLTYASNEQVGRSELDRRSIFDIFCIGQNGERFVVEMQKAKQNYFVDRSVYYTTFPIQQQALKGDWNYKLAAVYLIGILDFVFSEDKEEKRVKHVVQLKDEQCRVFYDKLTYIYLEMPHFTKTEDELMTQYDKWLYVLKRLPDLQDRPVQLQERIFQRLFDAAEIAKFNQADYDSYLDSLKVYRDWKAVFETAQEEAEQKGMEKGMEKGMAKGWAIGVAEGTEQGIEQGMEKGTREKAIQVARTGLARGLDPDLISDLSGLTIDEITALKNE
ncbi:Rpn family recombination-promoting nuclease/putative transposase [Spirosoma arcticum]